MLPLKGRVAVVTGVSRRGGIGFAIASQLARMGASLFVHHWRPHDVEQPWGADNLEELLVELREQLIPGAVLADVSLDLAPSDAGTVLIQTANEHFPHLDILICNHAVSGSDGTLAELTPAMLDQHWAVNTRSTLVATRAFAAQHDGRAGGRVIWITSGQGQGPMVDEIAYATSKAALAGVTLSVADSLIEQGIVLNTINPGPVNTGYLSGDTSDRADELDDILRRFPRRRFGHPTDPARLIRWLVSDDGDWIVGQTIHSEGGLPPLDLSIQPSHCARHERAVTHCAVRG